MAIEEKRIEVKIGPYTDNKDVIVVNHVKRMYLTANLCKHCKIIIITDKYKDVLIPLSIELHEEDNQYYLCLDCLQEELYKIKDSQREKEREQHLRIVRQYDSTYHHGPCKGICPKCKQHAYYVHFPEDNEELNRNLKRFIRIHKPTFNPIERVAESLGIKPVLLCFECYDKEQQ